MLPPFTNPFLNQFEKKQQITEKQQADVFTNVSNTKAWSIANNPYFQITTEISDGQVKDEYGFWISIDEYDELCFMDLKMDLDHYFDTLVYNETLENYDDWYSFVREMCPPIEYWKQNGSERFKHWPSEGRRLLDDLKMQYNMATGIKNYLLDELESSDSDFD